MHLRSLLAVTAGAALLLTGCGGSDKDDAATKPATSAAATSESPSASPSPTLPTVDELVAKAKSSFSSAPFTRLVGSVVEGGMTVKIDIVNDTKGNGSGSVNMGKGTAKIVLIGKTIYVWGDKQFWTENGGAQAAKMLNGKWVQAPATGAEFGQMKDFLDREAIVGPGLDEVTSGDVAEGPDGKTWVISDAGGALVLDKATGRPLSLKGKDAKESVEMTFSYPGAGAIQAPPKNKILKIG